MTEVWKAIPGYEGVYEVSDLGRVRSLERIDAMGRVQQGRMKSAPIGSHGYPFVSLGLAGKATCELVHRLVLLAFVGPAPPAHECRHLDGNRSNCVLANLRWGTRFENCADKLLHGTENIGERNGTAKLTVTAVRDIRERYARGGVSQKAIAADYGVSQPVIGKVVRGITWKAA